MSGITNPEVKEFAEALENWATEGDDREKRERLLKWLLSRCESRGFKSRQSKNRTEKDKYLIKRVDITEIDIKKAVVRAMKGYNPALDTSSWIRGGPIWPKGYGEFWPKGYA
jgi:hypothetical protein